MQGELMREDVLLLASLRLEGITLRTDGYPRILR